MAEREQEMEALTRTHVCGECGAMLVTPYIPETAQLELRCGEDKSHRGIHRFSREFCKSKGRKFAPYLL